MTKPAPNRFTLVVVPSPPRKRLSPEQRRKTELAKVRKRVRELLSDPKLNTAGRLLDALWEYARDD